MRTAYRQYPVLHKLQLSVLCHNIWGSKYLKSWWFSSFLYLLASVVLECTVMISHSNILNNVMLQIIFIPILFWTKFLKLHKFHKLLKLIQKKITLIHSTFHVSLSTNLVSTWQRRGIYHETKSFICVFVHKYVWRYSYTHLFLGSGSINQEKLQSRYTTATYINL